MSRVEIEYLNRHFTVEEIFKNPVLAVRGFIEKNYNKGMHSQEFYEINIVLRGSAIHRIGENDLTVGKGDVFIIPPNVDHGYANGEYFDVYHLLVGPRFLEKNSAELKLLPAFSLLFRVDPLMREKASAKPHFTLNDSELDALMPTLDGLIVHSKDNSTESAIIAGGEALIVIARLCAIYDKKTKKIAAGNTEDEPFLNSVAYIYENFDQTLTTENLAHIAQMSRTSYIERFKRVTGLPPARFQRQYRISVAKQLLAEGTLSETEIAQEVGCYDISHFIKMFKAETEMTPFEFRKKNVSERY